MHRDRRSGLPPPTGWYAVAHTDELRRGRVLNRTLAGQEIVLFQTARGHIGALDPFCPHLGAHLGRGGTVVDESLQCPFHGFRFAPDGRCVATGYGSKPPGHTAVRGWPTIERHGTVLVWFDSAGNAPTWTVPEIDERGWTAFRRRSYALRGHPQETTENSVDLGHLALVHGYQDLEIVEPLETDGPHLTIAYAMRRPMRVPGLRQRSLRMVFHIRVHGLGYSFVEVAIEAPRIRSRHLVLATPTGDDELMLRLGMSVQHIERATQPPVLRAVLRTLVEVGTTGGMLGYAHDVRQDFAVWRHKRYEASPALAHGDGPITPYRRWAQQFYPDVELPERA